MNKPEAKRIWIGLVKKYYGKGNSISDKLLRIQFIRGGEIRPKTKAHRYAVKHFPALLKMFDQLKNGIEK